MTAATITLGSLQALAEQLEADAARVREILEAAILGDLGPQDAVARLRELGIAIS